MKACNIYPYDLNERTSVIIGIYQFENYFAFWKFLVLGLSNNLLDIEPTVVNFERLFYK